MMKNNVNQLGERGKIGKFKRVYGKNGYKQYFSNKKDGGCLY